MATIVLFGAKGGTGKSTSAIHLAGYLQTVAPTLLVDGDRTRTCVKWAMSSPTPPRFAVHPEKKGMRLMRDFTHVVIDTQAWPADEDIDDLVDVADLFVIPTPATPFSVQTVADGVGELAKREKFDAGRVRVLLTIVPPKPSRDGADARALITVAGLSVFRAEIPRLAVFAVAEGAGLLVRDVADRRAAKAWECYESVGKEVLDHGREILG